MANIVKDISGITYCSNRNCPYTECCRHDIHIRYNYGILYMVENYKLNKSGNCEYFLKGD